MEGVGGLGVLILILMAGTIGLALYFLPSIIAWRRMHYNAGAILALNVVGGWTVLGWVVALVWAFTN